MVQNLKTFGLGTPDVGGGRCIIKPLYLRIPPLTHQLGWWDASVFDSMSITGSSINSINDLSGSGNHLINQAGTKPLYAATGFNSSFPTINFSNANNGDLSANNFPLGTGNTLTIYWVGHDQAQFSQSNARAMSYSSPSSGPDNTNDTSFFAGQVGTTIVMQLNRNGSSASRTFSTDNTPHRFIGTIDSSGVMTAYVDGVPTTGSTLNAAFGATGTFRLGQASVNNSNAEWHGVISEAGISPDFHDATACGILDTYLKNKWGM